jgi:membrane-bound serine protease (ClpP class)
MANDTPERWLHTKIGIIGASSQDILESSMKEVETGSFAGLLLELDTPGGALENTRKMVKTMMASKVPIVVWVGPAGSHAGSAGAFITLAAHVASMAPGTNIGAAHPIQASGKDIDNEEAQRKVMNDTVAFIESVAESRGRNVEMARSFVATSVAITAEEALKHKVVDYVEPTIDDLFNKIDGKEIALQSGAKVTLATTNVELIEFEPSLRQKALEILSNPNLFYLLFMAGLIGLGYELTHPGMLFPGIAGAICLILAFIAMSILPVSLGAIALIIVGVGLLIAEAFVPSFGILGISGFAAFVLGSVFLVDPSNQQGLRISLWTILPSSIFVGGAFLALGFLVLRSTNAPLLSGAEGMVGQIGRALADFDGPAGQIRVAGAIWKAEVSGDSLPKEGDTVKVEHVNGLVLKVSKT